MAVTTTEFTTGPATLPDPGELSYNGCSFSTLFFTEISGTAVKDDAVRTVKYMEYAITADGYVTLPAGDVDISPTMDKLRRLLTAQGGALTYRGRGMDLVVNAVGGGVLDVAWGPVPELLEFQPMGAGRSAKVRWQVKTRIPEIKAAVGGGGVGGGVIGGIPGKAGVILGGLAAVPMLQFCYETIVGYGEDGYSSLTVRGSLEIPLTRTPSQTNRKSTTRTADDMRVEIESRVMAGIDLTRFRVTKREFPLSRDRRTLNWEIVAEEKPYMDLPAGCTIARGTYSVRPAKAGMGLAMWLCTLRATYTVRADQPRRIAWLSFLALLSLRMKQSTLGAGIIGGPQSPARPSTIRDVVAGFAPGPVQGMFGLVNWYAGRAIEARGAPAARRGGDNGRRAWLVDFNIDEGVYLDSKTTTFSATWRLSTLFSHILMASGVWKKLPEKDSRGTSLWAINMRDVQGSQSWLRNGFDPSVDVIVDFGGG